MSFRECPTAATHEAKVDLHGQRNATVRGWPTRPQAGYTPAVTAVVVGAVFFFLPIYKSQIVERYTGACG
jgi:hypothetical protein